MQQSKATAMTTIWLAVSTAMTTIWLAVSTAMTIIWLAVSCVCVCVCVWYVVHACIAASTSAVAMHLSFGIIEA